MNNNQTKIEQCAEEIYASPDSSKSFILETLAKHFQPPTILANLDEICLLAAVKFVIPSNTSFSHEFVFNVIHQACLAAIAANESKWKANSLELAEALYHATSTHGEPCHAAGCQLTEKCEKSLSAHARLLKEEG